MRVRIRFAKFGRLRFLGHLDIMRYMQKAFRRTDLKLLFSEGYHPHPIMSFAQPLSLSLTSDGEYFDVEFAERYTEEQIFTELQAAMCEEIVITKVTALPDHVLNKKKVTGMSLITGATYVLELRDKEQADAFSAVLEKVVCAEKLIVTKKTKKGERECNIRPGIHGIWRYEDDLVTLWDDGSFPVNASSVEEGSAHFETTEGAFRFVLALDAGSENNISPELVIDAMCGLAGVAYKPLLFYIHRMDLFGDALSGKKVPLWCLD